LCVDLMNEERKLTNGDIDLSTILTGERHQRRRLIDILQDIQSRNGYLPQEAMLKVADFLDIPSSTVWGVATFYNQFRFTPPGKRPVKVCMGTACHLAGGQLVLEAMARELKIEIGGTTEDREFSLERVACIGCCALAPVVTIGEEVYPRMTPPKVEEILVAVNPAGTDKGKADREAG
jgi:NADH-quinone oxidoreductase subunit E